MLVRLRGRHGRIVVVLMCAQALTSLACFGRSPASPGLSLHVELADPAGDAPVTAIVPNPPDLVRATVDVERGTVTFALRFGPGWDQGTTFTSIYVDVDQNAATGVPGDGMGVEYELGPAVIVKFDGMTATNVGTTSVAFVADGMIVSAPLTSLGNDDGKMDVRVRVHHSLQPAFDSLPDANLAPGHVQ